MRIYEKQTHRIYYYNKRTQRIKPIHPITNKPYTYYHKRLHSYKPYHIRKWKI